MKFLVVLSCALAFASAAPSSSQWKNLPKSKRSFAGLHGLVGDNVISAQVAEAPQVLQYSTQAFSAPQQSYLLPGLHQRHQLLSPHQPQLRQQSHDGYSNQFLSGPPQSAPSQRDFLSQELSLLAPVHTASQLQELPPSAPVSHVRELPLPLPAPAPVHVSPAQEIPLPAPVPVHPAGPAHELPLPLPAHEPLPLPLPAPVHSVQQVHEHVQVQQQPQHVQVLPQPIAPPASVAIQTHQYPTQVIQTAALPGPSVATLTLQDLENIRAYLLGPGGNAAVVTESHLSLPVQHHVQQHPVQLHHEVHEHVPQIQVQPVPVQPVPVQPVPVQPVPVQPVHQVQPVSLQQFQHVQLHQQAVQQQAEHLEAEIVEAKTIHQQQPSSVYLPANH